MGTNANRGLRLGRAALLLSAGALAFAAPALGAAPDLVLRMPQSEDVPGPNGTAGGMNNPRGVAADPESGHVYVANIASGRINEYTAWGLFVKSWGWDVAPEGKPGDTASDELEICGPVIPESNPSSELCQSGEEGAGEGQFSGAMGLALDPNGNVYVFEWVNRRVQKFNSAGQFLLMFGGDVNKTKVDEAAPAAQRNVCPPGDVCQAGVSGEGPSQFDKSLGDFIAYSPTEGGTILVGDKGGIQVFDLNGEYVKTIAFEGALAALAGKQVNGLDVDKDKNIYVTLDDTEDVFKLSPTGEPLGPGKPGGSSFKVKEPLGVVVDFEGSVYAIEGPGTLGGGTYSALKYSAEGVRLVPTMAEEESEDLFPDLTLETRLTAIATNICGGSEVPGNLYIGFFDSGSISYVDAYGTGPVGCEPPPPNPPAIGEQFATFVGREEATLRALINPKFWQDATYYVEYGTGKCSEGGCPSKLPVPPVLLTDRAVNAFIPTAGVVLEGLAPSTTYRYRFVAQGSGGGPVFGIDPDGGGPLSADEANGLEATFTTHAIKGSNPPCANDAFRIGAGASLPDCRAYEMVSPLDKGNADVALGIGRNNTRSRLFEINQSAPAGERFTFSAATAFGDAKSAPFSSQYLAERDGGGWRSKAISPPRTESPVQTTLSFSAEFHGFNDDLCQAWFRLFSVAPLSFDAVAKYPNLYRRDNCGGTPLYAALTTVKPLKKASSEYEKLFVKGFSASGTHTIFTAPDRLHVDAPVPKAGEELLYERTDKELDFVCYLPNGKPSPSACSAGTSVAPSILDSSPLHNAISSDGSRIFWTAYSSGGAEGDPGRIYVRIDGKETVAVSGPVSGEAAFYWTAAEDGSKAIFQFTEGPHKGELYEFAVDAKEPGLIAKGVEGPMGASEDASRIYFASSEDLDGDGAAVKDAHNLYVYEIDPSEGHSKFQFLMPLTDNDVGAINPSALGAASRPVDLLPSMRAARVTPDGLHATFMSAASPTPTGYDNRDAETGKAVPEVYRYDATAGELLCVSCNPTGARPEAGVADEGFFAAARIQGWEANHHAPRVISDDGSRVFFESHEALVPEDSNGTWDVYEWEEPGKGTCTTARDTYSDVTGGCVDLISSGQSPARSLFLDADPSGDNVFFGTQSSLVGSDYGLNDVYVARVGGGFPEPTPPSECEGAACQSPPPPPPVATPASEAFQGPGDEAKRKCPKGKRRVKRKGKVLCVKKRSHKRKAAERKGSRR